MKYRIIEEVNGNDRRHFEVEFWKKRIFGWKWVHVEDYRNEWVNARRFSSYEEAIEYVKCFKTTRKVIVEGDTDVY